MKARWIKTFFLWDLVVWLPDPLARVYCRLLRIALFILGEWR